MIVETFQRKPHPSFVNFCIETQYLNGWTVHDLNYGISLDVSGLVDVELWLPPGMELVGTGGSTRPLQSVATQPSCEACEGKL